MQPPVAPGLPVPPCHQARCWSASASASFLALCSLVPGREALTRSTMLQADTNTQQ